MDIQKEIIRVTAEYFKDNPDLQKLANASKEYKSILNEICGQNVDIEVGRNNIELANGMALNTSGAALCLDDTWRTRQFIQGIDKAIQEKLTTQKPAHILYAGSGPFATLILPFLFRYSPKEIKYTLLEINPYSCQLLQNVISKLGLEKHDITLINTDATNYKIDPRNEPDIVVSETMQSALAKEPQVPIFLNLMSQLKHDSIFIPEKIELFVGMKKSGISMGEIQAKHFHKEKKVFEVSKESMFSVDPLERLTTKESPFTKQQTTLDPEKLKGFDHLVIITEIHIYKNAKIDIYESGLTAPIFITNISDDPKDSITIDTQYKISSDPKLEYKITVSNKL